MSDEFPDLDFEPVDLSTDSALVMSGTPTLAPHTVSLTFDDGPGPLSAELSRYLHEEGVPATFFVLRDSVERYGDALDTYRANGHVVALHGIDHRPFTSMDVAEEQLSRCRDQVAEYLGETLWYRPPYGINDDPIPGFTGPVGWHANGRDWDVTYGRGQTVQNCVAEIMSALRRRDGGIVLLHDFAPPAEFTGGGLTEADLDFRILDIVPLLLAELRTAGYALTGLPVPVR